MKEPRELVSAVSVLPAILPTTRGSWVRGDTHSWRLNLIASPIPMKPPDLRVMGVGRSANRPFYSSLLNDLAFEWQLGWRWPCFDTDFSASAIKMHLVSIRTWFTQQKKWCLYQNKVTPSLAAIQRPGHWADNCKMFYWSPGGWFYQPGFTSHEQFFLQGKS